MRRLEGAVTSLRGNTSVTGLRRRRAGLPISSGATFATGCTTRAVRSSLTGSTTDYVVASGHLRRELKPAPQTPDRYLGRPVLCRMYCTSCSSLVLTSWAVSTLVFSVPASMTRFGIDVCRLPPSLGPEAVDAEAPGCTVSDLVRLSWSGRGGRSPMPLLSSVTPSSRRSVLDRL